MSSRSLNLDVLVRLKDRLSGPLRKLRETFRSLTEFARKIGAIGAAISVISFMGPIQEAAAFQQKLLDIAGTANLSGKAAFQFAEDMRLQFADLALATGQSSDAIASAAGGMIAAGLDVNQVSKAIGGIAKAATGANASIEDMAGVATAMVQNLHVPIDQLDDAMASLLVAGRLGAFEFKEMARYFPTLTGQMAQYGVVGREAVDFLGSALQIAKMGTADPAEAANNLKNFLSKLKSQDTIKNFAKANVDIQKVMQNAVIQGINPVEAAMRKIIDISGISGNEITKMMKNAKSQGLEGAEAMASVREQIEKIGRAGKLGTLFGDQQVMDFLIPAILNVEKFKDIKRAVSEATGELIDPAFKTNMEGLYYQLNTLSEVWSQVSDEVGLGFGAWLPMLNENLSAAVKWYREFNIETNGMGKTLLTAAGGGVLLATAIGGLSLVLPIVGAGFAALGALISPVGIALAGLAAAGVYIWRNWGSYGPRLSRMWEGMKGTFGDLVGVMRDQGGRLAAAGREMFERFGPRIAAGLSSAWADVKAGLQPIKQAFNEFLKVLDIKVDFSGWTIDNAKIAGFSALEKALSGMSAAWQSLKDFGSGFALSLPDIGKSIGGQVNNLSRFADAFWRIAMAGQKLLGLGKGSFDGLFSVLGKLTGKQVSGLMTGIERVGTVLVGVAEKIADFIETLADLRSKVSIQIPWDALIPGSHIFKAWEDISIAMNKVNDAIRSFNKMTAPDPVLQTKTTNVISLENAKRAREFIKAGATNIPGSTDNQVGKLKDDLGIGAPRYPMPAPPPQKVDVGGQVTIKVEGPGKVTSITSTNPQAPLRTSNTGRVVGGV